MFSLSLSYAPGEEDLLIAELWEAGTVGIQQEEGRLRAFFEGDARPVMVRFAAYGPALQAEEPRDWTQVWQDRWEPILVGTRFFLAPAWRDDPTPSGRLRIDMHPGQACGTGAHPATQLSLEALEKYCEPGAAVLDIGAGSGILSAAATLLGAGRVVACDLDPLAIDAVRERGPFLLFRGSARSVRAGSMDLVLVNINAATIVNLAPEIARILRPEGTAIVAGFTDRDANRVEQAVSRQGLSVQEIFRKEDWLALVCQQQR